MRLATTSARWSRFRCFMDNGRRGRTMWSAPTGRCWSTPRRSMCSRKWTGWWSCMRRALGFIRSCVAPGYTIASSTSTRSRTATAASPVRSSYSCCCATTMRRWWSIGGEGTSTCGRSTLATRATWRPSSGSLPAWRSSRFAASSPRRWSRPRNRPERWVSQAYVERLLALRETDLAKLATDTNSLATELAAKIATHVESLGEQLERTFAEIDQDARQRVYSAVPPDSRAKWWFAQLVRAARQVDFYTNLTEGAWWTRLHLSVLGQTMRFVTAVQKVGQGETGVLAVTMFAERLLPKGEPDESGDDAPSIPEQLLTLSSDDSVILVHTDTAEERWQEVADLIDRTLAAAVDQFSRKLG